MKILHIDESFHTQYGYHTAPIAKEEVKSGNEVYVITVPADNLYPVFKEFGDTTSSEQILQYDREFENEYGVHIIRCPIRGYISYRAVYYGEIYKEIKRIDPDVILCHNSDSLMAIRMLMRKDRWPVVYDSHMLAMASQNKFAKYYLKVYRKWITPQIIKKGSIIIRTQDDPYIIEEENVPRDQAPFVSFGTDTNLFYYNNDLKLRLREKMGIGANDFVVCYAGKLNREKGADLLTELVQNTYMPGEYDRVVFLIVGNTKGEYGKQIDQGLKTDRNIVLRYPAQTYSKLAQFYQVADLSVFPKQCSLSFYDAQACGLPVLSEDNLVNVDRCSNRNGFNFKAGDAKDFCEKLQQCVLLPKEQFASYRQGAIDYIAGKYSYASIAKEIDGILTDAVDRYHKTMR